MADTLTRRAGTEPGTAARGVAAEILACVALGAFSLVFLVRTGFRFGGRRTYSLFDDAMISMRYARTLSQGHGLAWNATGKPVEGYTNLLWTLWMAVLHLFPVPERLVSALVVLTSAGLLVGNLVLVRAIVRRLAPGAPHLPGIAMWVVAAYYPLDYWALRGMEVGLVAVLSTAAVLLALRVQEGTGRRDRAALAVVLALAVLTRDDMVLPALIVVAWVVAVTVPARRRGAVLVLAGAVVGTFAAHTVFRVAYYGSALPNTYYLKLAGIPLSVRLRRGLGGLLTTWSVELFLPVAIAVVYLVWRKGRVPAGLWLLGALFAGQGAYSAYVGGDAWESTLLANRYLAAEATPLLILALVAAHQILIAPAARRRTALAAIAALTVPVVAARAADWRPAAGMQLGRLPAEAALLRVGLPLLVVFVFGAAALSRRRLGPAPVLAVLAVLMVVAVNGRDLRYWVQHNAFLAEDTASARLGLTLREATPPGTTVAFAAAGASAYFSHRFAIDLGGKSDAVVAREAPRLAVFIPGHDKFDLEYSVHRLAPDVVIMVGGATPADTARMAGWGYDRLAGRIWVRRGAQLTDRAALAAAGPYS